MSSVCDQVFGADFELLGQVLHADALSDGDFAGGWAADLRHIAPRHNAAAAQSPSSDLPWSWGTGWDGRRGACSASAPDAAPHPWAQHRPRQDARRSQDAADRQILDVRQIRGERPVLPCRRARHSRRAWCGWGVLGRGPPGNCPGAVEGPLEVALGIASGTAAGTGSRTAGGPAIEDGPPAHNAGTGRLVACAGNRGYGCGDGRLVNRTRSGLRHYHAANRWRWWCVVGGRAKRRGPLPTAALEIQRWLKPGAPYGLAEIGDCAAGAVTGSTADAARVASVREPARRLRALRAVELQARPAWVQRFGLRPGFSAVRGCSSRNAEGAAGAVGGLTAAGGGATTTTGGLATTAPAGGRATTAPAGGREAMAGGAGGATTIGGAERG